MNRIEEAQGRLHNLRVTLESNIHDLQNTEKLLSFELEEAKAVRHQDPGAEQNQSPAASEETLGQLSAAAKSAQTAAQKAFVEQTYDKEDHVLELIEKANTAYALLSTLVDEMEEQLFPMIEKQIQRRLEEFDMVHFAAQVAEIITTPAPVPPD